MTMKDYVELNDYKLWADGTVSVDETQLEKILQSSNVSLDRIFANEMSNDIRQFNRFSSTKIGVKNRLSSYSVEWIIPDKYYDIDIVDYISESLIPKVAKDSLYDKRLQRIVEEVEQIKITKSENVFKCIIYILDTMKNKGVFWGLGRGSSCSVYLFFLLELHAVDCVKYDIHYSEFFKGGNT